MIEIVTQSFTKMAQSLTENETPCNSVIPLWFSV
jgi:hypothetical protein